MRLSFPSSRVSGDGAPLTAAGVWQPRRANDSLQRSLSAAIQGSLVGLPVSGGTNAGWTMNFFRWMGARDGNHFFLLYMRQATSNNWTI